MAADKKQYDQKERPDNKPAEVVKTARFLVRVYNTDLDGDKQLRTALTKIKGIGIMFSNAICLSAGLKPSSKASELKEQEIKRLNEIIKDPLNAGIPEWMVNRRSDPITGLTSHLLTSDLDFVKGNDIKHMQKIKCYKGMRHATGQPVRGQRTRSNFRKNKGKAAGVFKVKIAAPAAADKSKDKDKGKK
jgi:small subunit ribosomal protein S13